MKINQNILINAIRICTLSMAASLCLPAARAQAEIDIKHHFDDSIFLQVRDILPSEDDFYLGTNGGVALLDGNGTLLEKRYRSTERLEDADFNENDRVTNYTASYHRINCLAYYMDTLIAGTESGGVIKWDGRKFIPMGHDLYPPVAWDLMNPDSSIWDKDESGNYIDSFHTYLYETNGAKKINNIYNAVNDTLWVHDEEHLKWYTKGLWHECFESAKVNDIKGFSNDTILQLHDRSMSIVGSDYLAQHPFNDYVHSLFVSKEFKGIFNKVDAFSLDSIVVLTSSNDIFLITDSMHYDLRSSYNLDSVYCSELAVIDNVIWLSMYPGDSGGNQVPSKIIKIANGVKEEINLNTEFVNNYWVIGTNFRVCNEELYITTMYHGVFKQNGTAWEQIVSIPESSTDFASLSIRTIVSRGKYTYAYHKDGEIQRYDGNRWETTFSLAPHFSPDEVDGLCIDSKGRIWINSTEKGVCFYDNTQLHNSVVPIKPDNTIIIPRAVTAMALRSDDVLVGTQFDNMITIDPDISLTPVILDVNVRDFYERAWPPFNMSIGFDNTIWLYGRPTGPRCFGMGMSRVGALDTAYNFTHHDRFCRPSQLTPDATRPGIIWDNGYPMYLNNILNVFETCKPIAEDVSHHTKFDIKRLISYKEYLFLCTSHGVYYGKPVKAVSDNPLVRDSIVLDRIPIDSTYNYFVDAAIHNDSSLLLVSDYGIYETSLEFLNTQSTETQALRNVKFGEKSISIKYLTKNNIALYAPEQQEISLLSLNGQLLERRVIHKGMTVFPVSSSGLYLLKHRNGINKIQYIQK